MAFIEKKDPIILNTKLTTKGRDLLSQGKLNFKYFGLGDSEIDYKNIDLNNVNIQILKATDKSANIKHFITDINNNIYNDIVTKTSKETIMTNISQDIGFFSGNTILTDYNHVKQANILINIDEVNGGTNLNIYKSNNYVDLSPEPEINDILLVKWINKRGVDTTGNTINYPTPYLFYKIINIISGSLSGNSLVVELDRELPNFSNVVGDTGKTAGGYILINKQNELDLNSNNYVVNSKLDFINNSQCDIIKFPYWNMNIIYTEEVAGVSLNNYSYLYFNSGILTGFLSYIQEQSVQYKKLGVIHYTNSSPDNTYGEGFYSNSAKLFIPTIMWYKSKETKLGLVLTGNSIQKRLSKLNLVYYDLVDETGFVVGKIFNELKLFVIEDQELLFAMSYKSNRNWTLPKIDINIGNEIFNCSNITTTILIPQDTLTFENNNEYIVFENNNEYIVFET